MGVRPLARLLFVFFLITNCSLYATNDSLKVVRLFSLVDSTELSDGIRRQSNDSIAILLKNYLNKSGSFYRKPNWPRIGKITSKDERLNIYTWNYKINDKFYGYNGIVQFISDNSDTIIVELKDTRNEIPLNKVLSPEEWYGCLYYDIVVKKKRRKTFYTLLGWDGYNDLVARKVIDVFTFDKDGDLSIGDNIFKMKNGTQKRVLFQFSASGSMVLVYDKKYKQIIFDHLSPVRPELKGNYQYYGPDFSYDGFKFKRRKWEFVELLDPRNRDN